MTATLTHKDVVKRDGSLEIQGSGFPKRNYYLNISGEEKPLKLVYRGKSATGSRASAGLYIKQNDEFVRVYANLEAYNQLGELSLTFNDGVWEEVESSYECVGYGEYGFARYVSARCPMSVFSVYEWVAPIVDGLPAPDEASIESIGEFEARSKRDIEAILVQVGIYDYSINEADKSLHEFASPLSELAMILADRAS